MLSNGQVSQSSIVNRRQTNKDRLVSSGDLRSSQNTVNKEKSASKKSKSQKPKEPTVPLDASGWANLKPELQILFDENHVQNMKNAKSQVKTIKQGMLSGFTNIIQKLEQGDITNQSLMLRPNSNPPSSNNYNKQPSIRILDLFQMETQKMLKKKLTDETQDKPSRQRGQLHIRHTCTRHVCNSELENHSRYKIMTLPQHSTNEAINPVRQRSMKM